MKSIVYLLRHGAYKNPKHILPVRLPGFHLSQQGVEAVKRVAQTFLNKHIVAVYTSPLERARETAETVGKILNLPVSIDERLIEIRSPAQGKPENLLKIMEGWKMYESDWYTKGGGETIEDIAARMHDFMKEKIIKHRGRTFIAVSHGDPIMIVRAKYEGKTLSAVPYIQMGEVISLEFS
jgi:broad specificity phosphatase PhoE